MSEWGSPEEVERRNRILVSAYAYAYEEENDPLVDDATYDDLARRINKKMHTGNPTLDAFFRYQYLAHTGSWVLDHPEIEKVANLVRRIRNL